MDLNHLALFSAVAEAGSFTAAATALALPKSTVSRGVVALEESLGVRLLQRTTRSVALTTAGRALLDRVGPRLRALTESLDDVPELSEEPSGALRITATADFATEVLAPILAGFCRRYPRIELEVHLATRAVDLVKEGFDAAFRFHGRHRRDSSLIARKVGDLSLELFAAPAYLAARGTPRTVEELPEHDFVSVTGAASLFLGRSPRHPLQLRSRLVADDGFFIREMARSGMGIAMLPRFLTREDVAAGRLVRVLPRFATVTGGIYLVMPSMAHLPRKMLALRDHVIEALGRSR